jgi:hypothetical protein
MPLQPEETVSKHIKTAENGPGSTRVLSIFKQNHRKPFEKITIELYRS